MNALGNYPGDGGQLGGECAGHVEAVGAGVEGLLPGQRVMAVAPGCLASHVIAKASLGLPVPEGWSLEQAATIPPVFLAAAWALRRDAAQVAGARVLHTAGNGRLGCDRQTPRQT